MVKYTYKARNNEGQPVMGQVDAESQQEALVRLSQMELIPIAIDTKADTASQDQKPKNFLDIKLDLSFLVKKNVKTKDIMIFCSNLSSMTNAGVPLLGAINTIADQIQNPEFAKTLHKVAELVSQGSSFSEALAVFPKVFPPFFISMVKVGEMSGTLDETLKSLAIYLDKQENLRQTVQGIMIYPSLLMVVGTGVVVMILTFLMPKFVEIFTKANVPLPLPTQFFYALSLFLRSYWIPLVIFIIALTVAVIISFRRPKGREFWDRLFLKLPLISDLIEKTMAARLCRTLGIMLTSGVSLLVALNMVKQVLNNVVFVEIMESIYTSVEKGEGITRPLSLRKEIPKDVTYMISVGEQSGNLGYMLNKIADFYEAKVQNEVKNLVTLIEPAFIVILGIVVGGIMASMILPLFDHVK